MIISDSNQIVFIHNPKCAGTTVRHSLMGMETRDNYYWMYDEINGNKIDKAHLPLHLLKLVKFSDFLLLENYFSFGFVRCPYRRAISAFNEINRNLYKKITGKKIGIRKKLKLWVRQQRYKRRLNEFIQTLKPDNVRGFDFQYRHFVLQESMFFLDGKPYADLIVKVEDMGSIESILLPYNRELAKISSKWNMNKKNVKPVNKRPDELLDKESIKVINAVYAKDFEVFGYDKLLFFGR